MIDQGAALPLPEAWALTLALARLPRHFPGQSALPATFRRAVHAAKAAMPARPR